MRIFGITITTRNVRAIERELELTRSMCKANYEHEYAISEELERVRENASLCTRLYDGLKKEYAGLLDRYNGLADEFAEFKKNVSKPKKTKKYEEEQ